MLIFCTYFKGYYFHAVVYVSFAQESYSVSQDSEVASVCLELTVNATAIQSPLWVNVSTENKSALGKIIAVLYFAT